MVQSLVCSIINLSTLVEFIFFEVNLMAFTFADRPLEAGRYEPEGIYLHAPFEKPAVIVQQWGANPAEYADSRYNGVGLKGYIGLGFSLPHRTQLYSVDSGSISEISVERDGFGRYIKIEHRWGESFYAGLDSVQIDAGQKIERGTPIALSGSVAFLNQARFHFGIRIAPYNRFDGWGGFSDPLPYLDPELLLFVDETNALLTESATALHYPPFPMVIEMSNMRRP